MAMRYLEDVKKLIYAGCTRVVLNFSKESNQNLLEEAANRFGREKMVVSLNDFDTLFKQQSKIKSYCDQLLFMHRLDLNSLVSTTDLPGVILTDAMEEEEILKILKCLFREI